jgi:hypothetical protein
MGSALFVARAQQASSATPRRNADAWPGNTARGRRVRGRASRPQHRIWWQDCLAAVASTLRVSQRLSREGPQTESQCAEILSGLLSTASSLDVAKLTKAFGLP